MKNQRWFLILLSLLLIGGILSYILFVNQNRNRSDEVVIQAYLDNKFVLYLDEARANFNFGSISDPNQKETTFLQCISDLSASIALYENTSYKKINMELDISLHSLLKALQDQNGARLQIVNNAEELQSILNEIVRAPSDIPKTKRLSDYISRFTTSNP
ncbi:hypothetical protein [Cohnella sp. REN36]|uniref:hypothetical protein n=1 Tax=Cohnella sp. REN36 TaxID=2887347 RepID=UPI001D15AC10|nr:hypothetical protein [Cohnella sp. REN36]MCC3372608.1 hypothetical protein [Cohnella sp. REN36]